MYVTFTMRGPLVPSSRTVPMDIVHCAEHSCLNWFRQTDRSAGDLNVNIFDGHIRHCLISSRNVRFPLQVLDLASQLDPTLRCPASDDQEGWQRTLCATFGSDFPDLVSHRLRIILFADVIGQKCGRGCPFPTSMPGDHPLCTANLAGAFYSLTPGRTTSSTNRAMVELAAPLLPTILQRRWSDGGQPLRRLQRR